MKNLYHKIKSNKFLKNVSILMSGTILVQIIPMVISPLLTRLYTPEDFGVYTVFTSIITFLFIISTLRYEMAIVLPKQNKDALSLVIGSMVISILLTIITFLIFIVYGDYMSLLNNNNYLKYLSPLLIIFFAFSQVMFYWFSRQKDYRMINRARLGGSIGMNFTQLALGVVSLGKLGLIIGYFLNFLLQFLIYLKHFLKLDFKSVKKENVIFNFKKYKKFPMINFPHALIDSINQQGIIFIGVYFFGASFVGQYGLMMRVLKAPVSIIGTTIGQVFYQSISEIYNRTGDISNQVKKMLFSLSAISLIPSIILFVLAPDLFAFIFGEAWREAGNYSRLLMPYIYFHFITSPLSMVPLVVNKQGTFFLLSTFSNILFIGLFFIGGYFNDIKLTFKLISTIFPFYYLYLLSWIYKISKRKIS